MKKNHKRISAAVLSLALGFTIAGAPMLAPVASAQISAGQISSVNLDTDVSLTINKYVGYPLGTHAELTDPADLDHYERLDAEFKIEKVKLTNALNTYAGWEEVAALTAASAASKLDATFNTTGSLTVPTGNSGTVTVNKANASDFTVGVYLITELPKAGYTVADPFLVTLPFADATATATGGWNYHQTVYPKNQEHIDIEKGVSDSGIVVGGDLAYTISAPVPAGTLSTLSFVDDLPAQLSAAKEVEVFTRSGTTETAFAVAPASITTGAGDGNQLEVNFNQTERSAIQTLREADEDLELVVKFKATVTSVPANGSIVNHASINLPDGNVFSTSDPDNPDDGAETRISSLTINKRNTSDALITTPATFELWRCVINGDGDYEVTGSALVVPVTGVTGNTKDLITDAGSVVVTGIQAFDWVNGATAADQYLCAVETKAPAGFVLNPEPQPVEFDADTVTPYDMVVNVTNLEDTITGQLPETGGNGTMALIGAGVLVAAAGGVAAVRGNRARNK